MRKGLGRHNYRSAGGPVPSLVLDFAGTGTLDPRVTFTRSTTGTYYNSSGVLTTAAINAARFDYNPSTLAPLGLLIEQLSTNLILYSEQIDNAAWTKSNVTPVANATTAPNGTSTADLIYPTTTGASRSIYQLTLTANTISVYAKFSGIPYIWIVDKTSTAAAAWFNLSTGSTGTVIAGYTSSIQPTNNGWYRCILTANTGTFSYTQIGLSDTDNSVNSTKNGTDGVYIWGSQAEALAFSTSYIPTTSAQVTRASDNASMTGTNFSSWYNQGQGTLYSEFSSVSPNSTSADINSGSTSNFIRLSQATNGYFRVFANGSQVVSLTPSGGAWATGAKEAGSYAVNSYAAVVNGGTVVTANAILPVGLSQMNIGADSSSGYLNGRIKKISYYPTQLTNAQLQALTGS